MIFFIFPTGHKESFTNAAFSFRHDAEEEGGFQLVVENTTQKKPRGFRTRASWRGKKPAGARRRGEAQQNKQNFGRHHEQRRKQQFSYRGRGAPRGRFPGFRRFDQKVIKESSVEVKSDWVVIDQLDFNQLGKLKLDAVPEPEEMCVLKLPEFVMY